MMICSKCGIEKPFDAFEKKRKTCRPCRNLQKKEYYLKTIESGKAWYPHLEKPIFNRLSVNANRTAHQRGCTDSVTPQEIENYLGYPKQCYLCSEPLTTDAVQLDHIVPIFKGGTNTIHNLAYIHSRCNRLKSGDTKEELKTLLEKILKNI